MHQPWRDRRPAQRVSPVAAIDIGAGGIASYGTVQSTASGVIANGAATISNDGLISGAAGFGVQLLAGGALFNDAGAKIQAAEGVSAVGASVANYGTISGLILGIALSGGAHLTNGSSIDRTALITAANGVAETASTLTNYGTIQSTGLSAGLYSVHAGGGSVRNQTGGVIEGYNGATFSASRHAWSAMACCWPLGARRHMPPASPPAGH